MRHPRYHLSGRLIISKYGVDFPPENVTFKKAAKAQSDPPKNDNLTF
jgi:hypothetical protein